MPLCIQIERVWMHLLNVLLLWTSARSSTGSFGYLTIRISFVNSSFLSTKSDAIMKQSNSKGSENTAKWAFLFILRASFELRSCRFLHWRSRFDRLSKCIYQPWFMDLESNIWFPTRHNCLFMSFCWCSFPSGNGCFGTRRDQISSMHHKIFSAPLWSMNQKQSRDASKSLMCGSPPSVFQCSNWGQELNVTILVVISHLSWNHGSFNELEVALWRLS